MSQASRELDERDGDRWREALVGRVVAGKYAVTRLIGRGGMGAVFEGEHVGIGRKVALKFLDRAWAADETVASRFAREARVVTGIESDHIVSVLDAGTDDGLSYLVMELLRGEDLGRRLRRERRVPVDETIHVATQVLRGLAGAHAAGIVHRDLKPDNVFLVERPGEAPLVKIVDFGISKVERPRSGTAPLALTQKGVVLGTPLYMSPEQAQALKDLDARADLYSLGAIMFECLSGRPPHVGETYEQIIVSICIEDAPDLRAIAPGVPDRVAAFVARALARDRAKRFQSAHEMLDALRALAPNDHATRPLPFAAPQKPVTAVEPAVVSGVFPPIRGATEVAWSAGADAPVHVETRVRSTSLPIVLVAIAAMTLGIGLTLFAIVEHRAAAPLPATSVAVTSASAIPIPTPTPPPIRTQTPTAIPAPTPVTPAPRAPAKPAPPAPRKPSTPTPAPQPDLQLQREAP